VIAHVGGLPVEELLGPLLIGTTVFVVGARVFISRRLGLRRPVDGDATDTSLHSTRERSPS
jgi:hypothetical protein